MKFVIENFGCQMNDHDMEKMGSVLIDHGHVAAKDVDDADVVIVNTCCIRKKRSRSSTASWGGSSICAGKRGPSWA